MTGYTRDDALAFIDSLRALVGGRKGFKWLGEKFSALAHYIETTSVENELMSAFIADEGARERYEAYRETRIAPGAPDDTPEGQGH